MTLQEAKDQIAKEHGFKDHQELASSPNIPKDALGWYYDRAAEFYAKEYAKYCMREAVKKFKEQP